MIRKTEHENLMRLSMLAGEVLATSGAETYRVEETIERMLGKGGFENVEVTAMMTSISAMVERKDEEPLTYIKAVHERGMNLSRIIKANQISRDFCDDKISVEKAYEELRELNWKQYNSHLYNIAIVGITAGFALFFGGTMMEVLLSIIVGVVLAISMTIGKRLNISSMLQNILCGFSIAFVSSILDYYVENISQDILIISSIMPLVPGVSITNAVRDLINADYISGNARVLKALLIATGIAVGIGTGLTIVNVMYR